MIAVEPVPETFTFLSKTLKDFKNVTLLNVAISDEDENLKLYISDKRNVTSSSNSLLIHCKLKVVEEIVVKSISLSTIAKQYPISMLRMDVEGHEYYILNGKTPDPIETICMELHILPPYGKTSAKKLLQHLDKQGFQAAYVIKELGNGFSPIIKHLGLKTTYRLIDILKDKIVEIDVKQNINLIKLSKEISREGIIHLILAR